MKRLALRVATTIAATAVAFSTMYVAGRADAAPSDRPCVIAAVGDIGKTPTSGKPTAALIRRIDPVATLGLGDLAYPDGSDREFKENFLAHFNDLVRRGKFYGTPGNHEHHTENAQGFRNALTNVGRFSHYGVNICGWRWLAIDTELPISTASQFVMAQRARYPRMPMGIFTHKPCMSNGGSHGDETGPTEPLCDTARKARVSLILSGHEHNYERFAVMGGLRQFVAGTGGADLRGFGEHAPGSQAQASEHGVLFIAPRRDGYSWQFRTNSNQILDRGSARIEVRR